jgi:hypothetical protein
MEVSSEVHRPLIVGEALHQGSSTRSSSSVLHQGANSLCDPVRLSATALRILELEKIASAQTSAH